MSSCTRAKWLSFLVALCYNSSMIKLAKKLIFLCLCAALFFCTACNSVTLNADSHAELTISEVVTSNALSLTDPTLGSPDWIELYNASEQDIDLTGYGLSDNVKEPHKWAFPSVTIKAGEYLVVYAAKNAVKSTALCANLGLSKAGESLFLSDPYYNLIQRLDIPELVTDVSYAQDANGDYGYCNAPTPGAANTTEIVFTSAAGSYVSHTSDALVISEIMPRNKGTLACADGSYVPWAELYNTGESAIMLSDYSLSDSAGDTLKWKLPATALQPGGYAVVYFSGKDRGDTEIHAGFKLSSADNTLCLSGAAGNVISIMTWDTGIFDDVSVVADRVYTAEATPLAENSALTFSTIEFSAMDNTDPVRMSEILKVNKYSVRDSYGDRSPWVELHNASAAPVSLEGYYLTDDQKSPFKWAIPAVTLDADGYLVIFLTGQKSTADELHASFSLGGSENALMLTDMRTMRCDLMEMDPSIGNNISIGKGTDDGLYYYATPTPGAANTTHGSEILADVSITNTQSVSISEVSSVSAAKSGKADWIELYNGSSSEVNLEGWHLTDDADVPDLFTFPSFPISPGGYAVINASTTEAEQGVTAPFSISASGNTLLLYDSGDEIRDVFETGALRAGVTAGRIKGSVERVFFTSATKGTANAAASFDSFVAAPVFSDTSLYHDKTFELKITCPTPDAMIYYTLDGSAPTSASTPYTGPVSISANTAVRAAAMLEGRLESDVVTSTFLFEKPHTVPVICITMDSESFDQVYSVTDRWLKVEREGYFEYYETDGKLGTAFPCGYRANGASTLMDPQKSLSIFLRGGYGQSKTAYPFFGEDDISSYSSLVVRASGQDHAKARLRDSFFQTVAKGLNIESIETRVTVVYINGKYWGIYDLNENQNEDYLAAHYGVNPNAVDIIRRNTTELAGKRYEFKSVREYALNTDTSNDANYEKLCQWIDVDYFNDYLIAQTFFTNADMFNQKYWRSQDYTVKWRPVYYDLDLALSSSSPSRNVLPEYFKAEGVPSQDGSLTNMDIYCGLRRNKNWCLQFGERYIYVVENYFNADRLTSILDEMERTLEPEMARHIARWKHPRSVSSWESSVDALRGCLTKRKSYAIKYLQSEFGFTDAQIQEWTDKAHAEKDSAQ